MQLSSRACTFEATLRDRNLELMVHCNRAAVLPNKRHTQNFVLVMFDIEELIIKKQSYTGSVLVTS